MKTYDDKYLETMKKTKDMYIASAQIYSFINFSNYNIIHYKK